MGTAPRPWQRNLSNLSVTGKVGIVLLLPVILASAFAVFRIRGELDQIGSLTTASEQSQILQPALDFGAAANQLAVTAAAAADHGGDPTLDQTAAKFDQAAANLQSILQVSTLPPAVSTELTEALAGGRTLRNSLHGASPAVIGQQADDIANHVSNSITVLSYPKDTALERYYVQLVALMVAHRLFTQEQLLITAGEIDNNPATLARVLTSAGAELTMISQYAVVQPSSAYKPDVLQQALQTRIIALSQNSIEPINVPGVVDSMRISTATYNDGVNVLVDLINTGLAARSTDARSTVLRDVALVVVTLLAGLTLALAVARSLVVPVRRLRRDALKVAHSDLPAELEVVREGGVTPEIVPVDVHTTEEIGQLARAVDDMHRQALHLAAEQARLRVQISNMFETLSRRSQSLVEQQLTLIEDLERDEDDSDRLQSLFRLDHLATRMRRNGDNLLVLAGTALRRGQLPPVPLSDMLWSAVSQVEDYQRVEIGAVPDGIVSGEPAVDIEHLLAELIDNSLRYSPPTTPVAVSVGRAVDGGYLIEITDRGLGMSAEDLRSTNERLGVGGEVTVETARRMGLYVVGRLAKRHTITVSLRRTSSMAQQPGITASVHLPGSLVSPLPDSGTGPHPITSTFPPTPDYSASGFPAQGHSDPPIPSIPTLTAVPNAESAPFPVTSAGLPQRRPAAQIESPPLPVRSALPARSGEPQRPAARLTSPLTDQRSTGALPFVSAPERPRPASVPDLWQEQPVTAEPPTDLWAETTTFAPMLPPPPVSAPEPAERIPARAPHNLPRRIPTAVTLSPQRPATDLRPVNAETPTPIYQRMVSEWLVEPSSSGPAGAWSSPADEGWAAAEDASTPTSSSRTSGGLPIRRPGAQLVPGGLNPASETGNRSPEEIRSSLSRHLSGVRSGRVDAQYTDGGSE